jgi:aminoglycoside phosphotransferase (APT) family kinase protein
MEADDVRRVVAAHLPGQPCATVTPLGAGLDHTAWEVDGTLVVRCGDSDPVAESRLLTSVAAVSPVPVPRPIFADAERGCLAYPKLDGTPLLHAPPPADGGAAVARTLSALIAALQAATPLLAPLVEDDRTPPAEWLAEARTLWPSVRPLVPPSFHPAVAAFLAGPPPADAPVRVFAHNDLGIEHVLVSASGAVTGVIDWSDAAVADPARDVALLYRDLGPAALLADGAVRERAVFHARCGAIEDLAYGEPAYVRTSLRSLSWLFG